MRFERKSAVMPNLAGLGAVMDYAAKSYLANLDNFHKRGLQQHWARACGLK